jgi:hypothetical protein
MASERLEGRNGKIWRSYAIKGMTCEAIAEQFSLSSTRVSEIVAEVRATIPAPDREHMLQESLELIKYVKQQATDIVEMAGAPIFVGKDGDIARDPEGNVVRDYSGRMAALNLAIKADDTIAKRLGLDAATKTESTASVKFELIGIDIEELT